MLSAVFLPGENGGDDHVLECLEALGNDGASSLHFRAFLVLWGAGDDAN